VPSPFAEPLRLGVIWCRVADQSGALDGVDVSHLDRTSAAGQDLRPLDPHLYDRLGQLVARGDRSIRALVSSGVLPADTVSYDEELPSPSFRRTILHRTWCAESAGSMPRWWR
jgi:hypothetical protein